MRRPSTLRRTIERDLSSGDVFYRIFNDGGEFEAAAPIHLEDIDLAAGFCTSAWRASSKARILPASN